MAEAKKAIASEAAETAKRDFIRAYELAVQKQWAEEKVFELDAPADASEPKWLGTFPYPYMNGRLHLGHAFTFSKVDIAAGYERLKGRRALFPFAFHCTGMPIKAAADKLKREIETYGNPPNFELAAAEESDAGKKTHSKTLQKVGAAKFQWDIMKGLGVPEEDIPKFANAEYWVHYFPPLAQADLQAMGGKIDWRRSFITTDVNPYYDAFIRWQFNKLRALGKVKFGKRETIYSIKDGQPCLDHERASGEGVGVSEYTLVKQELLKPYPPKLADLEAMPEKVYLVPATLRPETMYGQTNCWVLPEGEYVAVRAGEGEIFIMSERSARNLAYQDYFAVGQEVRVLVRVSGQELIGAGVKAPLSPYPRIYVLPMMSINMDKTTGVVTSVPSDSPDDWAAYRDLRQKPAMQEKFGVKPEMVSLEVVPIIRVPGLGDTAAVAAVDQLKIKSQNDRAALDQAKDWVYLKGFNEGTMLVANWAGQPVAKAKPEIKKMLVEQGLALRYFEPERPVVSRSGDTCIVALIDQWYLDYGEEQWAKQAYACLAEMETYGDETRRQFEHQLGWIHQWACSRSYGLGSRIPWDPAYLIESLSDSTVYMAYYTVAHLLQASRDGTAPGPARIAPEHCTDALFDYIFQDAPYPPACPVPEDTLRTLRAEFKYWYPVNLRVSGKDLIPNHLTFWIYNHVALFPEAHWPTGVKANGFLNLNGEKMSKQTGNFITLADAVKRYSADGMRLACAAAGDTLEDANFTTETADTAILRLHALIDWAQDAVAQANQGLLREDGPDTFADRVFEAQINRFIKQADADYERMQYRQVTVAWHTFKDAKDSYLLFCEAQALKPRRALLLRWISVLAVVMAPILSHTSEYLWRTILKNPASVFRQTFPAPGPIDAAVLQAADYIEETAATLRAKLGAHNAPPKKKDAKPNPPAIGARIYLCSALPEWQSQTIGVLEGLWRAGGGSFPSNNEIAAALKAHPALAPHLKKAMPFANNLKDRVLQSGPTAFNLALPFNEKEVCEASVEFLRVHALGGLASLRVLEAVREGDIPENAGKKAPLMPEPAKPLVYFDTQ